LPRYERRYLDDEFLVVGDLLDASFLHEGVERDGEGGLDEAGEVEVVTKIFPGE
jgi:hypothetical protein